MSDSKTVSRIEWLCAAMIDFIPIIIFSKFEMFLRQHLCFQDAISVISILLAVYMLLKDFLFDGRSIGKRFVNIRIVRPDNYDKDCLILRNLPLSLMVLLLVWQDMAQYIHLPLMRLGFVLYMWADFICFAQKGKTIGDCLAHTSLEVSEDPNYLLQKDVSKRIACFVVVLILLEYEGGFVSPHMFVSVFTDQFIPSLNLTFAQCFLLNHSIYILFQCVAYVYVLCKLVEYKHLRGMVMVLFGVYLCCDIYTWSTQDLNISWVFILLYIVIVAVLLYMTTNRRLGDSQIRTDLENKLWDGCDLQKGKNYVTIVVMVSLISVLFPVVLFSSELFLGFFPLAEALFFVLLLILFVMLPVVYLSEKYIHQGILRWIICVTSFLCVIIGNISYVTCLIFT